MPKLLSIVILSYNRPKQLERILSKFIGYKSEQVNIIIKDDVSPKYLEVQRVFEQYSNMLDVELVLHVNDKNLGYDLNLLDAFLINNSTYTMLLSDDDYLDTCHLDKLLSTLENNKYDVCFTPYTDGGKVCRTITERFFPGAEISYPELIYNSILFSGLVFRTSAVLNMEKDYDFLSGCIYSQVYIAVTLISSGNGYGVLPDEILYLGGDGENYFGKNQSAVNAQVLADRQKISANLEYQAFLLNVVKRLSDEINPIIYSSFSKEYVKRLIAYGLRARSYGVADYIAFIKTVANKSVPFKPFLMVILSLLLLLPRGLSGFLYCHGVGFIKKHG